MAADLGSPRFRVSPKRFKRPTEAMANEIVAFTLNVTLEVGS